MITDRMRAEMIRAAERDIQLTLMELSQKLGDQIEAVEVDSRPLGAFRTQIFTTLDFL